ncbi:hypothetical protein TWF106_006038 [Orbilia oligospora]|uniref:Uncharacterized protein n=1 Tax=Orbilia oligospora TaxID=2813651 RepID=A0A6G1M167_ORBOL|nr:hypothetical protein TWF106_006038 [Orbilia oligospora]KAF3239888.1 hypothetical protein TWF192_009658 [Orbilia oligospora]
MSTSRKAHFKIPAIAGTDIWRKPSTMLGAEPTNVFNAPTACLGSKLLRNFHRARISFSLPPRSELSKYDQGGLLLSLKREGEEKENSQWIKTGIEYYLDEPWVGTVCCDRWADWSIASLGGDADSETEGPTATIEVERSDDELGKSLWIYLIKGDKRIPLREVNWIFAQEHEDVWVDVSAYTARPLAKEGKEKEELIVKFWDDEVVWRA